MKAKANPWFRVYVDILTDDRLALIAFEDQRHYFCLLACKCSGVLDSSAPYLERRVAAKLRLEVSTLEEVKRRLMEVGLIDDQFQPVAWGRRQFLSDSSVERTRKYRGKTPMKRHSDGHVTARVRLSDVLDTETESEAETESPPLRGGVQRGRARAKPTKRMPRNWQPSTDLLAWAATEAPQVDLAYALATIRDHEFKNPHTDWDAVVRNWLRRDQSLAEERVTVSRPRNGAQQPLFRDDDTSLEGVEL
jgi:hypothetical protein